MKRIVISLLLLLLGQRLQAQADMVQTCNASILCQPSYQPRATTKRIPFGNNNPATTTRKNNLGLDFGRDERYPVNLQLF
ncbi:MAG: hypothetical protein MUC97_17890 [Bernardetiaceae bacterium]|nr:hypothetical protein [Bernardetiaceae bacterium]